jgi:putative tryptophan/tyrosine transport system substrate-binding protein
MDRRAFIGSLALATLAGPRAALAQPARKVARIGIISAGTTAVMIGAEPRGPFTGALLRGLRELGYVYGRDFVTEPRGAEGKPERLATFATELVRLQVDVIVAGGQAAGALKQATSTIPVVLLQANDPVGGGYAQSLAHPGGNFTGISSQQVETTGKRLELLKELVPGAAPVGVIWDRQGLLSWQAAEAAAQSRGWKLLSLEIRGAGELEETLKAATKARASALLVYAGGSLANYLQRVAELIARYRLPAMYDARVYTERGGLISYGPDGIEMWRRAAVFVDKILKGAKSGDLPIEQPTKFDLRVNLKTAKAIGLAVPDAFLLRADEVIE